MTGHAQPLAILKHPGIGEAPEMLIGLAAVEALRMIVANNDGRRAVHFYLHIVDTHDARLKLGVGEIRQESSPISDCSVPLSIDELVISYARNHHRVANHLHMVPQSLH